ncbi:MAG: Holliday junction resolvase RuvX [Candidatus Eiseniibacteriota bacterium]|nr:MAG: Holliday junction resolvase RuvX [Candidatus Eisenbacteria bacterium]
MGIDFGDRRLGVAISDPQGLVAGTPSVLHVKSRQEAISKIRKIVGEEDVSEIVVGFPLSLSGLEGPQAGRVKEFASALSEECGIRVSLWDERYSTAEAERLLLALDKKTRKQKGKRDLIAAVLILQSYLDRRSSHQRGGSTRPA